MTTRRRYDQVAKAFGCFGAHVQDPAEIRPAPEAAANSGLPAVIHVVVDQEANVHPRSLVEFGTIGVV